MFAYRNIQRCNLTQLEHIENVVRQRYGVGDDQIVLVSEEPTRMTGGPEYMTTVLFWRGPETRYKVRMFKPAADVTEADLPPSWLQSALLDDEEADCC